jgi:S-DNA-T family DNA segregation ATPase FtsK/SpoIIIE
MAKKKQSPNFRPFSWLRGIYLSPETKHSIGVIFILLLGALMLLGLFDMAGVVGVYLVKGLKYLFGRGYFIFPFLFFIIGLLSIDSERFGIKKNHYFGLGLLLMSLLGLLHLRQDYTDMSLSRLINVDGGGYIGWFVSVFFYKIMGFWATLTVLVAIFLAGIFLAFNTSFQSLLLKIDNVVLWRQHLSSWWYHLWHRDSYSPESIEEEVVDEELPEDNKTGIENIEFSSKGLSASQGDQEELIKVAKQTIKIELPIQLLDPTRSKPTSGDIQANKEKIRKALQNFGIEVEMGEVSVGPTVTQYTLRPDVGVKLASITALHNDLALALSAHPIRIEAPIPGQPLVGIEVPNQSIATVSLREIIGAKEFASRQSNLTIGLGKDVAGKVWTANLDKMPHLLIAGATGSGKSVCINTLIVSLLYQNNPDDLRFILVDPKRVELAAYNDLPYLYTPVITDVKKTVNALKWAVGEMDERYIKLSGTGHKNIAGYNKDFPQEKMPYIVIVIDELADLMSVAAQEVEAAIIRLAQMARAVGIHLVLATQRPSVNVITGLIKANITTRIAFAVASQTDSRTILDCSGAEKLLGKGDMLFISSEVSKPKRLQSGFVSDEEIVRITDFIKKQAGKSVEYNEDITEKKHGSGDGNHEYSGGDDDLLDEARSLVIQTQKASASYLQRRLRVGYARAARLLDLLEEEAVIGPGDGAKPREVLIARDDYENNFTDQTDDDSRNI